MNYYNSSDDNDLLDMISQDAVDALIGCNIPDNYPKRYNPLNYAEFKEVVSFLNVHYRKARNTKTQKSGSHGGIASHCQGKVWLIYYDALLHVEGNTELDVFAFLQLPLGRVGEVGWS